MHLSDIFRCTNKQNSLTIVEAIELFLFQPPGIIIKIYDFLIYLPD